MQYSIDLDQKILHCEFEGHLNSDVLIEHIRIIRVDHNYRNDLSIIADFRKASYEGGFVEMYKIIEFIKTTSQRADSFRLSIIIEQPRQNRGANLYRSLSNNVDAKICTNLKEAEAWVRESS